VAYLSRETVKWLKIWLEHANISERAVFRRVIGADQIGDALNPGSIAPIFKRVAQWIMDLDNRLALRIAIWHFS
jgi:hypothetical protein